MLNFDFYNPTHIVFGKDRIGELDNLIAKDAKVMVLYGGGSVKKYGTFDKVLKALNGREIVEFGGIEPNPKYETLMKAVELIKKEGINFLLAVGGGSVIDGTKFVNLAVNYEGENAIDLLYNGFGIAPVSKVLDMGTVLTLAATGSEMNLGAVISYGEGKFPVMSPLSFPKFSILDPTVTFTLPEKQIANGIVDAFIHVAEQYVTYPVNAKFQDRTAEGIMQTLIEEGKKTIENPEDYDSRSNLVWCATMALNGLIGSGVPQDWACHMIGHEITALFGVDHGRSLAIVLPSLWRKRKDKKRDKLIQYAERVWGIKDVSDDNKIERAIDKTQEFFESLGIKTKLSDYGIDKNGIDKIIKALEKHGMTALSESRDQSLELSREILEAAL